MQYTLRVVHTAADGGGAPRSMLLMVMMMMNSIDEARESRKHYGAVGIIIALLLLARSCRIV